MADIIFKVSEKQCCHYIQSLIYIGIRLKSKTIFVRLYRLAIEGTFNCAGAFIIVVYKL